MADEEKTEPKRTLIPVPVFDTVPRKTPKFMVVGDTFTAQTDEGDLQIGLKIPTKLVPQLEDLPMLEQVKIILQSRGDEDTLARLDELDIIDTREVARKYFQAFGEKEQARLGESFTSST